MVTFKFKKERGKKKKRQIESVKNVPKHNHSKKKKKKKSSKADDFFYEKNYFIY